ncbi:MAG: tetratricopeptide repeat protein [Verrucomicrobiota bacterium]
MSSSDFENLQSSTLEHEGIHYKIEKQAEHPNLEKPFPFGFILQLVVESKENGENEWPTSDESEVIKGFAKELLDHFRGDCVFLAFVSSEGVMEIMCAAYDPDPIHEHLTQRIESENHPCGFQYALAPDPEWKLAFSYLDGTFLENSEDETNEGMFLNLGDVEESKGPGFDALDGQDYEKAIPLLNEQLSSTPSLEYDIVMGLALARCELEQYEEARNHVNRGMELRPEEPNPPRLLGVIQIRTGDYDRAEKSFVKCLELKPAYACGLHNLACVYSLQKRRNEMIKMLKLCFALEPLRKFDVAADSDFDGYRDDEEFQELTSMDGFGFDIGSIARENPHSHTIRVIIPETIDPIERGERFEEPVDEALSSAEAGCVLGGGTRIDLGGESEKKCHFDIGTDDLEQAIPIISSILLNSSCPPETFLVVNPVGDSPTSEEGERIVPISGEV